VKREKLEKLWHLSTEMLDLIRDDPIASGALSGKVHALRAELEKDLKNNLFQEFLKEAKG